MVNDTNVVQIAPILRALAHDVAVVGVASEKKNAFAWLRAVGER